MTQVISFEDYTPAPRYDEIPWSEVRIEESVLVDGPYTQIDVIALDPVDQNPASPASRSFTTALASDTDGLWYRLIFADEDGATTLPLFPVQNAVSRPHYATAEELALLLRVNVDGRRTELERVLQAAAAEIDAELGLAEAYSDPPALAAEVNIERAVEHWNQMQSPFGVVGLGGDVGGPAFVGRDTWDRHAHKLAPLKVTWGLA